MSKESKRQNAIRKARERERRRLAGEVEFRAWVRREDLPELKIYAAKIRLNRDGK